MAPTSTGALALTLLQAPVNRSPGAQAGRGAPLRARSYLFTPPRHSQPGQGLTQPPASRYPRQPAHGHSSTTQQHPPVNRSSLDTLTPVSVGPSTGVTQTHLSTGPSTGACPLVIPPVNRSSLPTIPTSPVSRQPVPTSHPSALPSTGARCLLHRLTKSLVLVNRPTQQVVQNPESRPPSTGRRSPRPQVPSLLAASTPLPTAAQAPWCPERASNRG